MNTFSFVFSLIISFILISKLIIFISFSLFIKIIDKYRGSKKADTKTLKYTLSNRHSHSSKIRKLILNVYEGAYRLINLKINKIPSNTIRRFLFKHIFSIRIGKKVLIHRGVEFRAGYNITIGDGSIIGDNCLLDGRGILTIGKNVNFSSNASVYTFEHNVQDSDFSYKSGKVIIKDRVWISCNSIILPNTIIGEGTVLAANAVATKNLDSFSIYMGIPAQKKGIRNQNLSYQFDGFGSTFF